MKNRKRRKSNPLLVLGIVLVVVIAITVTLKMTGLLGGEKIKDVSVGKVKLRTITSKVNASGNIQPVEEVKISPEVPGEIKEILVKEGDSVSKGDLLLRIRPDNLISARDRTRAALKTQKANLSQSQSRLTQSKAQLIQQQQAFNRQEKLYAEKVISQQEHETAKANYDVAVAAVQAAEKNVEAARYSIESAEATVKEAEENLNLTKIYAPMSGIITLLSVEVGERVVGTQQMAGTEMLRIANLANMEVSVDVNENDIIRISKHDSVIIEVDAYAYQEEEFKGVVTSIANSANSGLTSSDGVTEFEVKILILSGSYKHLLKDDQASPFRPGMTASVEIITEKKDSVLTVPLAAVTVRKTSVLDRAKKKESRRSSKDESDSTKVHGKEKSEADDDEKKDEPMEVVFLAVDGEAKILSVKPGIIGIDYIEIKEGLVIGQEVITWPYREVSKDLKHGDKIKKKKKDDND